MFNLAVISYANGCIIATLFIVFSGADYYGKKSISLDYDRLFWYFVTTIKKIKISPLWFTCLSQNPLYTILNYHLHE